MVMKRIERPIDARPGDVSLRADGTPSYVVRSLDIRKGVGVEATVEFLREGLSAGHGILLWKFTDDVLLVRDEKGIGEEER